MIGPLCLMLSGSLSTVIILHQPWQNVNRIALLLRAGLLVICEPSGQMHVRFGVHYRRRDGASDGG